MENVDIRPVKKCPKSSVGTVSKVSMVYPPNDYFAPARDTHYHFLDHANLCRGVICRIILSDAVLWSYCDDNPAVIYCGGDTIVRDILKTTVQLCKGVLVHVWHIAMAAGMALQSTHENGLIEISCRTTFSDTWS